MNRLIIIRGLPGSGKSTLADYFVRLGFVHYETDQYFLNGKGEYYFQPELLRQAHEWCQTSVFDALNHNKDVVVSNTFSKLWEMEPYLKMTSKITVITCEGNYGNSHNVPQHTIDRMKARWEKYEG